VWLSVKKSGNPEIASRDSPRMQNCDKKGCNDGQRCKQGCHGAVSQSAVTRHEDEENFSQFLKIPDKRILVLLIFRDPRQSRDCLGRHHEHHEEEHHGERPTIRIVVLCMHQVNQSLISLLLTQKISSTLTSAKSVITILQGNVTRENERQ